MRDTDWKIRSYQDGKFMVETVHRGDPSALIELESIESCGRTAEIIPMSKYAHEKGDPRN